LNLGNFYAVSQLQLLLRFFHYGTKKRPVFSVTGQKEPSALLLECPATGADSSGLLPERPGELAEVSGDVSACPKMVAGRSPLLSGRAEPFRGLAALLPGCPGEVAALPRGYF
jgi:hypothetical protein